MLAAVLASLVLSPCLAPQAPVATVAALRGTADAVAIRGTTELSAAEAYAAAKSAVADYVRNRWTERGERELVDRRPFWLPAPLAQQAVQRWLVQQPIDSAVRIVDREDITREHEFGQSFQTTVWIAEDARAVANGERQLRRELGLVKRRTLVTSGATVGFWAVLGLVLSWLDRLSRGYMTGRLRLIGLLLGVAVPALAFLR